MTSTTTPLNGNRLIFFSPTHTSAQIARAIGEGIGMGRRMETDLTLDESSSPIEMEGELCVIVTPVYGGRVPALALQRLQRLKGNGAPAILVVVYGNRDYEDALLELRDTAISLGFMPLTAGAFIGEHSYSTPELPIAAGRPDTDDLQQAREFGKPAWINGTACTQPTLRFPNWPSKETFPINHGHRVPLHAPPVQRAVSLVENVSKSAPPMPFNSMQTRLALKRTSIDASNVVPA